VNVAPGQRSWIKSKHRKRAPNLAFKMKDSVEKFVPESGQCPVHMRRLTAVMAMIPDYLCFAIEALATGTVGKLARRGLNRGRQ
jgi:hypothetical protein